MPFYLINQQWERNINKQGLDSRDMNRSQQNCPLNKSQWQTSDNALLKNENRKTLSHF